jgi:hypothetical protein
MALLAFVGCFFGALFGSGIVFAVIVVTGR